MYHQNIGSNAAAQFNHWTGLTAMFSVFLVYTSYLFILSQFSTKFDICKKRFEVLSLSGDATSRIRYIVIAIINQFMPLLF